MTDIIMVSTSTDFHNSAIFGGKLLKKTWAYVSVFKTNDRKKSVKLSM